MVGVGLEGKVIAGDQCNIPFDVVCALKRRGYFCGNVFRYIGHLVLCLEIDYYDVSGHLTTSSNKIYSSGDFVSISNPKIIFKVQRYYLQPATYVSYG